MPSSSANAISSAAATHRVPEKGVRISRAVVYRWQTQRSGYRSLMTDALLRCVVSSRSKDRGVVPFTLRPRGIRMSGDARYLRWERGSPHACPFRYLRFRAQPRFRNPGLGTPQCHHVQLDRLSTACLGVRLARMRETGVRAPLVKREVSSAVASNATLTGGQTRASTAAALRLQSSGRWREACARGQL